MNDPMEGYYRPSSFITRDKQSEQILAHIDSKRENIGVACFSETYQSELMWAHYSGNYEGICVEYVSERLRRGLEDGSRLVRVSYVEEKPRLSSSEAADIDQSVSYILSHKKMNWYYEREWRVLGKIEKNSIVVDDGKRLITRVYLGSRIDKKFEEIIKTESKRAGISVYQMTVFGYSHKWSKLA
jgi:hypothetical protein